MPARSALATAIVPGVRPEPASPARVAARFRGLLETGARLRPAGRARRDPEGLLLPRYLPRHELSLFDAVYFLSGYRHDEALGFFVAHVALREGPEGRIRSLHPRILYKDSSLVWRVASHFVHDHEVYWIGKGDVRWVERADGWYVESMEETTNLPFELQRALDELSRRGRKVRDDEAVELVLRQAPAGRIEPYADFVAPRRAAAARHRIHGGRPIARFLRRGDPGSLVFARGYEPDFGRGVLESWSTESRFFGGELRKFRILSANRVVQYLFMASPTHAWVNPPQALTTELSTYGVRTDEVAADEYAFLPGYEYHEEGEDEEPGPSQIPRGFAGAPHPDDPSRADASAWLEALPVIRDFRRRVLARQRPPRPAQPSRNGRARGARR